MIKVKTEPVKVLYFVDRMLRGGIQSLVIDWVSRFDKNKIHVDFLLLDDGKEYELEQTLKELGCTVYKLKGIWVKTPIDFIKYKYAVKNFFKEHHDYKVVHMHSSSKNYMFLKYAKKYGIPMRIAHSHNIDFQTNDNLKKIIGNVFKKPLIKYSTDYFACSKIAGEWLFGKKIVESDKFKVIHNAIDYEKFKYDEKVRKEIRKTLKINDSDIVIGNVGRFSNQKNHLFLLDIFNATLKINSHIKLVLVGQGENERIIREKINHLGINDKVIITGFRNDVNKLMQGMDVFLMPSLHEGLPVVGVEAQAAGLPCFMSKDVITNEVKILDSLKFISLHNDANYWAKEILSSNLKRVDSYNKLKYSGYLIEDTVKAIEEEYLKKEG